MPEISTLFVTRLYRAKLNDLAKKKIDLGELRETCYSVAEDDEAGQEWCEENDYPGYTSYASLDDLPWRMPIFGEVQKALNVHVAAFCEELGYDLKGKKLKCNALWINILPEGGTHSSHIHPHSVISGTTYVSMPEGTSALKLEDPRLPMMMTAPLVKKDAPQELQRFIYVKPEVGEVLLWESWLRHEVPMNMAEEERISVSFNYGWE
ncbi:MAG TPA: TIGR02466 family protein [Paracoccaceae bacterium]|nr:TIGR02466 family protein [Paracoccaceae bacterium]